MILGLTGKTGTGKHTAAAYLRQKGWTVVDADTVAHSLYEPDTPVYRSLVEAFSDTILAPDRTIDRSKLSDLVFDPGTGKENLKKLNFLVHPALMQALQERVADLRAADQDATVVAALWQEVYLPSLADRLVVVRADFETAFRRIRKRDGISREAFTARWEVQTEPVEGIFLTNQGKPDDFYRAIDAIL